MKSEIKGNPSFGYLDVDLAPGETVICESDAMASMAADLDLSVEWNGGFFSAIFKRLLGKESLFLSKYRNGSDSERRITIVQSTPGQITRLDMQGGEYFLQPGAYLASTEGVRIGISWAGLASFLAREGLFRLKVTGNGTVWFGAFGGLVEHEVHGEYVVDSGHLVAYDPSLQLSVGLAGGIFSSLFGGEGIILRLTGNGKIYLQSRSLSGLASWVNPKFW